MASLEWTADGLRSLVQHDAWRVSLGWEPITAELYDRVEAYFRHQNPEQPPKFVPGRPVQVEGQPTDLRVMTVTVRSKAFRIYFRYLQQRRTFEILRILHPGARLDVDERQP